MNSLILEEQLIAERESAYSDGDLAQIDPYRVPHHIAIIMDGNRRWAKQRGLPSVVGHWKGAENLTHIVRAAADLGVKVLTVFAFSTENWGRTPEEIEALMQLIKRYLLNERKNMVDEGVRLDAIGDITKLPEDVQQTLKETKEATASGQRINLVLALNYGGRDDLKRAVCAIVQDCKEGKLSNQEISEDLISHYLDTARWPDPEILIRTSGELRQSNFLLWQLSYSEFYSTQVLWPEFDAKQLLRAVKEYQKRERRLGKD